MIKSIYLENWKTHSSSKLKFYKGTNILLGIVGSGKSSIVDAICYSLYGTYPSLANKKVILDETIMFKPLKKDYFKLILELEFNEKNYTIEREVFLGSKANSAKVYLDEKLVCGPKKKDVDEYISKLLGIDYNLFVKVVYSQQNEIDYFLKIIPSKRKEQFDDLFGISHFDKIKVLTKEVSRVLDFEADKNKSLYDQLETQLKNYNLKELLKSKEEVILKLSEVDEKIKDLDKKISVFSLKLNEKNKIKEENDRLKKQENILNLKIEEVFKKIEFFKNSFSDHFSKEELLDKKEKLLKKQEEFKQKQEKNKQIEIKVSSLKNKIDFYKKNLNDLNKNLEYLKKSIIPVKTPSTSLIEEKEKLNKTESNLKEERIRYTSFLKDVEKSILELSKGFSKCPVCDSSLSKEQLSEKLSLKKNNLKEFNEKLINVNNQIISLEKEKKELEVEEKNFEKNKIIDEKIKETIEKIDATEKELTLFTKELNEVEPVVDLSSFENEILKEKDEILKKEEFLENKSNLEKLKIENEDVTEKITSLNYNEDKYISFLTEYKGLDNSLASLKDKKKYFSESLDSLNKQIEIVFKIEKQLKSLKEKHSTLSLKKQDLSYFLKSIENTQLQLRKVLINDVNNVLSVIWPKVYPYKDYLSARLNAKNDYILEVLTQKNDWIRVEGLLSGGERACASLSIRIAISLALTKKLGLLILDEPTHNLDEKTIDALSFILEEELPDLVDQIFIVTHDKKLLETLNANKYIIERDKENDSVSKINF